MNLYNIRVTIIVRLQGANGPQEAEKQAWQRIERLIASEPLARVTATQLSSVEPAR